MDDNNSNNNDMDDNMDDEVRNKLIEDVYLLIKEGIGMIYSGDGRWSHNFDLIFNKFLVKIELSFDLIEASIDICEGISCNSVVYTKEDPMFNNFVTLLKTKFNLDNVSKIEGFLDEMENYKNGDLESLHLKMSRFIKAERFEEAEKIRLKMESIKVNNNKKRNNL